MKPECQKVTPEQVAPILGISPNEIRYCLRKGTLPIGRARPSNSTARGRKKSYRYDIYKNLVMEYAGLTEWPEGGISLET